MPRPTPSSLTAPAAHQTTERNTKVHPPALTVTTFGEGICFGGPVIIRQSSVSLSDVVDTPKQYYAYDCRRQYNGVLLAIEEEFESNRSMHTPPQFPPSYHLIDFTGLKVGRQKIEGENEKKRKKERVDRRGSRASCRPVVVVFFSPLILCAIFLPSSRLSL